MTDEDRGAIERAKEALRQQILHLRKETSFVEGRLEDLTARRSEIDGELEEAEAALKDLARIDAPQLAPSGDHERPRKRRPAVSLEEGREAMQRMGRFTIPSLADELGVHVSTARRIVTAALEHNGGGERAMIRDTGKTAPPRGGQGRHSTVYEFFKPPTQGSEPHSRPRSAPEVELRRRGARPAPTGRRLKVTKNNRELIEMAQQGGYEPKKRGGHIHLVKPGAKPIVLAGTGSEYRGDKNAKAEIKRATAVA